MAPIQKTLRITGLPLETHQDDVRTFFESHVRSQGRQSVEAIGPICLELGAKTNQTTVTFSSPIAAQQALNLDHPTRQLTAVRGGREIISLDHEFRGITTLQSFANPDTGKPDIEYVPPSDTGEALVGFVDIDHDAASSLFMALQGMHGTRLPL